MATGAAAEMTVRTERDSTGMLLGIGAYGLWGLLPLYLRLVAAAPAMELLAHRVVWSLFFLLAITLLLRRTASIRAAARGRTLALLCGSALLIATNWLIYMWAALSGHVLEASLGYFINPLMTVGLGVVFLGERLRRMQGLAIALAAAGVLALLLAGGGRVWIPVVIALSFAGYGLVRKLTAIDALGGLLVETLLLAGPALGYLLVVGRSGAFAQGDVTLDLLLVAAGIVTSVPLVMFAAAARRLPLATLGLLQFIAPTIQLALAVLVLGEPLRPIHALTFGLIWSGLALYLADGFVRQRAPAVAGAD